MRQSIMHIIELLKSSGLFVHPRYIYVAQKQTAAKEQNIYIKIKGISINRTAHI